MDLGDTLIGQGGWEEQWLLCTVHLNNGFSNREISLQIKKAVDKWYADTDDDHPPDIEHVKLFYKNQCHLNYKKDERALHSIIEKHVKPISDNSKLKLIIYYKNKKSSNLIMKNNPAPATDILKKRNIVYSHMPL